MASQNLNVTQTANSKQGDKLRDAFIAVRKMFAEMYGITYTSDTQNLSGTTFKVDADRVELTNTANSGTDGHVLTYDDSTGGFTLEEKFDGDITEIVAGDGLTGDATSGISTLNVVGGTGITANLNDVQITDNGVGYDQLSGRYTEKAAQITSAGTVALSFDNVGIQDVVLGGNHTIAISGFKTNCVMDILISGAYTPTLSAAGSPTFNRVGTSEYDNTTTNILQILCVDDNASNPVFLYAIAPYQNDDTP